MSVKLTLLLLIPLLLLPVLTHAQSRGIGLQLKPVEQRTPYGGGYYRALIIGNSVYRDKAGVWTSLKTAVTDARAVSHLLRTEYGFSDVETLENATRRDVLRALDDLAKRALPDDNILVYYAGHGFLDDESQRGYWVPVDAEGTDNTTYLRNSTIRDELNLIASRSRHTLLISDSCFSGTLLRPGTRGIQPQQDNENYFKKVSNKKSVQIMAAGGVEYVDDNYQSSGHSPFTYFLLNELKNNDRDKLTVSELSQNVTMTVANNVEQTPESGVLQGAGDELGEFIFIKMKLNVQGVKPENVRVNVKIIPDEGITSQPSIEVQSVPTQPPSRTTPAPAKPHLPMPTL